MSDSQNPARYPQYLPFPQPVRQGWRPVPNASAVNWPQAQFAPAYLPPGSPSTSPYRYTDGPVTPPDLYVAEADALSGIGGCTSCGDLGCLGCGEMGDGMSWDVAGVTITPKCVVVVAAAFGLGWLACSRLGAGR